MKPLKIFVVDDDPLQIEMITDHLGKFKNFSLKSFQTGEDMLQALSEKPDIVILDYNLDTVNEDAADGLDILRKVKDRSEKTEVIMYSGQDSIEVAINTMKYGAFDYVVKNPSAFHRMENLIYKVIKHRELEGDARRYRLMIQITVLLLVSAVFTAFLLKALGLVKTISFEI